MKNIHNGDIFSVPGVIVHGCNAQGVMGSGFAYFVRTKYPQAYNVYKSAHNKYGELRLGTITFAQVYDSFDELQQVIVNGVTQRYFGRDLGVVYADYDAIRLVFKQAAQISSITKLPLHFPKIGAGLANGDWSIIQQIILEETAFLEAEGIDVILWTIDE